MARNIILIRNEAEDALDALIAGVSEGNVYGASELAAQIVHKFGISDKHVLERWPEDQKACLEYLMYPLPDNHPAVRNK